MKWLLTIYLTMGATMILMFIFLELFEDGRSSLCEGTVPPFKIIKILLTSILGCMLVPAIGIYIVVCSCYMHFVKGIHWEDVPDYIEETWLGRRLLKSQ